MIGAGRDESIFSEMVGGGGIHRLAEGDDEPGGVKVDAMALNPQDHRRELHLERADVRGTPL